MNRRRLRMIVAMVGLISSLCAVAYPLVSNYLTCQRQEQVILSVEEQLEGVSDQALDTERKEADAYNRALASYVSGNHGVNIDEAAYAQRLNMGGDGVMGILTIPKLNVKLPIYHGTDAAVLDKGIGHIYGTSLPVGGKGTHAALSGHTGMAGQRMFSDLDQLKEGDIFRLRVLGEELIYMVNQICVVLPTDVSELAIEQDKDYVTLVTCTPYGVNTHRLLVQGIRVTNSETEWNTLLNDREGETQVAPSTWRQRYILAVLTGIGGSTLLALLIMIIRRCGKRRR